MPKKFFALTQSNRCGLATAPIAAADKALYRAKAEGRNCIRVA